MVCIKIRNWESIALYARVSIRLEADSLRNTPWVDSCSLKQKWSPAAPHNNDRKVRVGQKKHLSHIHIGKHSHRHSEPDSINKRPASFLYLSLTPQVRSCFCCWSASPKPCCACNAAHVRGDTLLTMPTAWERKFSVPLSLQWQRSFIHTWNCTWSPFLFFFTSATGIGEAICPLWHYIIWKCAGESFERTLLSKDCWGFYRWPFTHMKWIEQHVLYSMCMDVSLCIYKGCMCLEADLSNACLSQKTHSQDFFRRENKSLQLPCEITSIKVEAPNSGSPDAWLKTHPQVRCLQIALMLPTRGAFLQQLFAIICQKEVCIEVFTPHNIFFLYNLASQEQSTIFFSFSCHFTLALRRRRLCLSEKALINPLWSTCRALNRR